MKLSGWEKYCYYFLLFVFVNDFVVFIYIIFYFVVYESLRNICVVCVVKFFWDISYNDIVIRK